MNNCPACGSTRYNCGFCKKCKFLNNPNHLNKGNTKKYEHNKFQPEIGMTYEKPNQLNSKEVKMEEDQTTEEAVEETKEEESEEAAEEKSEESTEEAVPDPVEDGAEEAEEEAADEDSSEDSE